MCVFLLISVTITTHPVNTTKCAGEIAVLTCVVRGNLSTFSSSDLVWKTESGDYEIFGQQSRYSVFEAFSDEGTRLDATLRIKNLTTDDEGWYMFTVGSNVVSNGAYLNVITAQGI